MILILKKLTWGQRSWFQSDAALDAADHHQRGGPARARLRRMACGAVPHQTSDGSRRWLSTRRPVSEPASA